MLQFGLLLLVRSGSRMDKARLAGSILLSHQWGSRLVSIPTIGSRPSIPLFASRARTALPEDSDPPPPPDYFSREFAVVVFDNVYFYGTDKRRKFFKEDLVREVGNMTVKDVFDKWCGDDKESTTFGLLSFTSVIGALGNRVLKYYDGVKKVSIEEILAEKEFLDFSGSRELRIFQDRRLPQEQKLPILQDIFESTMTTLNSEGKQNRTSPVGLVLGSSGSGKTFFSLECLARQFLTTKDATKVSLYLHAGQIPVKLTTQQGEMRKRAAKEVIQYIKEIMADTLRRKDRIRFEFPLNMHVCVIIDEAGSPLTKEWFEDAQMLADLSHSAKELATSVAVVISGTGLTGRKVSLFNDVYIFRMKPWESRDVTLLLDKGSPYLFLQRDKQETTTTVANAIFANPKLGALATNARAAYFVVQAIAELSPSYPPKSWRLQLHDWTPIIFANVLSRYIASSSIRSLNLKQRRLVAAAIFQALDEIKPNKNQVPNFAGLLQSEEIACAESLLQYNVHLDSGTKLPTLVDGAEYAITITPAIAIVLYVMAGVKTTLMLEWSAEEELAALYAVRQLILKNMKMVSVGGLSRNNRMEQLGRIRLVGLNEQLQQNQQRQQHDIPILVPIVGKDTVLINRDKAAFVDIIAPYMLMQLCQKQTKKKKNAINLHEEMKKCCLLRNDENDPRLLQGLIEVWRGNLQPEMHPVAEMENKDLQAQTDLKLQRSKGYPENLLHLVPQVENVEYAAIVGNDMMIGNKRQPLPSVHATFDGNMITFMLSINMDKIRLLLSASGDCAITIAECNLDDDLKIKVDMLNEKEKLVWTSFLDEIREGVQIKFLMPRSVQ